MTRFELGLEEPDPKRAPISAATIAISYLVGGLIPLLPYMLTSNLTEALKLSVLTTGVSLLIFGGVKGHFTSVNRFVSAGQTLLVGRIGGWRRILACSSVCLGRHLQRVCFQVIAMRVGISSVAERAGVRTDQCPIHGANQTLDGTNSHPSIIWAPLGRSPNRTAIGVSMPAFDLPQ